MLRCACTLTLAVVVVGAGDALPQAPRAEKELAPREWMTDYGQSRREARRLGLPLIVHFHTSWCGPCRQMEREFLGTPAMREVLGEKFVGVMLDGDSEQWLVDAFRIKGYPADVVVAPGGMILHHTSGQRTKAQYFQMLDQTRQQHQERLQKARALALAQIRSTDSIASTELDPRSLAGSDRPGIAAPLSESTPGSDSAPPVEATEPLLVGLDGYSPVAIIAHRKWVRGRRELAATHQGILYYLADEEERRQFQQSPRQFVPKMLGCDPVELWRSDRAVQGSVQFGAFFDRQLYLFQSSETRNEFKRDPSQYIRMRHAIHVDEISGTRLR